MKQPIPRILALLLPCIAFLSCQTTPQERGERADAKGYDGIYYGASYLILADYGNATVKVPSKVVVFPDGKSILSTCRCPSGTLSVPLRVTLIGNHARWKAKPSFRWGPRLARTVEAVADFYQNPPRIITSAPVIQGKPFSCPPEIFYKQGTKEAAALERQWAASNTWHVPGEKFSRPVRNIDRGEIPRAGDGIAGTFFVSATRNVFGSMALDHVGNTPGGRKITLRIFHPDVIPHNVQPGDRVVISQDSPLISGETHISFGGQFVRLYGFPFNPADIKPSR
jgi:hypothetical protein